MNDSILSAVQQAVGTQVFAVWFLIGTALVFWMQAGFAMVEAGFTRAKNTGNIIMKNLMDFCIGAVVFIAVGFGLLMGEDLAVGLFATDAAPDHSITDASGKTLVGLFYGGGLKLLSLQLLGFVSVAGWTVLTITAAFLLIRKTMGLRASKEEELVGLDRTEHGLPSAYAGFSMLPETIDAEDAPVFVAGDVPVAEAVPIRKVPSFGENEPKLTKVEIVCKEARLEALKSAMVSIGITGMTVSHVLGCGVQKGTPEYYRGVQVEATLLPKVQIEIVVSKVPVRTVIETAKKVLYTGHIGDGKIFVYDVENVIKVRTGEEGFDALQDVE